MAKYTPPEQSKAMLMGVLAISGIPLFSGWYSKDEILVAAAEAYNFSAWGARAP